MARDYFFPTPDLLHRSRAGGDPQRAPRRGRPRVAGAGPPRDVPIERAAARGLAQRDRHAPASRVHRPHPRDLRTDPTACSRTMGYDDAYEPVCDSMWGERQSARLRSTAITPTARTVERRVLRPHPGRLRPALPHRSAPAGARAHPVLRSEAPLRPHLGRGLPPSPGPAGLIAFPGWLVHSTHPNMANAGPEAGEAGNADGKGGQRRRGARGRGGTAAPSNGSASASTSGSGARRRSGLGPGQRGGAGEPAGEVRRPPIRRSAHCADDVVDARAGTAHSS